MQHELRGIELVRTIIFPLVLVVAFFKGIFCDSEFDKNNMTSNMFCFSIMLLVISQVSCFRPAEGRWKKRIMKVLLFANFLIKSEWN